MIIFYHKDGDGRCSGFWAYSSARSTDVYERRELVPIDYVDRFPIEMVYENETVYIVDFSIHPNEMRELLKITTNITWIDHHITAIEKYNGFEYSIRGLRYNGIAASMLTYCYLHKMTDCGLGEIKPFNEDMTIDAPTFTKLIADYDVWKFKYGEKSRLFQNVLYSDYYEPDSENWSKFLNAEYENEYIEALLSTQAVIVQNYKDNWAKLYLDAVGFETEFMGYKCFAMNIGLGNSGYFNSLPQGKYDIIIPFVFNGEKYKFSLYSTTVNVAEIAESLGGGGHIGAAGFESVTIPFTKTVK